jgi:hypothetical protein
MIRKNVSGVSWEDLTDHGRAPFIIQSGELMAGRTPPLDPQKTYTYDFLKPIWEPETETNRFIETVKKTAGHFHVLAEWQDFVIDDPGDPSRFVPVPSLNSADYAKVSFTRDQVKDKSYWNINGSLFGLFTNVFDTKSYQTEFVPSISVNKVQAVQTNNSVDSLVFRTSLSTELNLYQSVRYGWFYSTDTNFKSGQTGGELEWEPRVNSIALGRRQPLFPDARNALDVRWRIFAHAEGGDIFDRGGNPTIKGPNTFVRIGPFTQLELFPLPQTFDWRLIETTSFRDYEAVNSGTRSTRLFITQLGYVIGTSRNVQLGIDYKEGRQQFTEQYQRQCDVSLGLKF